MTPSTPVLDRTLPNGLRLLLREDHSAPVASFWTWYRVGSRDELPGSTGISHWVEHMQFKGTPTLAKGAIFGEVSRNGGTLNALTSNDWTAYYETLPADRLDLALRIESDRMVNSLFDPDETESERTVILSERQGGENNPSYLLYEEVIGAAFRAHPYRHMVIGHAADLRAIQRDDLYAHYRRYYHPANAFVAAAGAFDAPALAESIERSFGPIQAGDPPPRVRAEEPAQLGERRVTLRRPSPTAYLRMAFHAPAARHPDTPALLLADAILSGAKGMGFGGGGAMGRSARLYRSLVATGLARSAGSSFGLTIDPYLLAIGVTALPATDPLAIEEVVEAELARLRDDAVPEDELARAIKQVKAQYVYSAEGVTNQAFWLGQMETVDGYRRADSLLDELTAVTPDDVRRVARTYLVDRTRTVGWLLPEGGGDTDTRAGEARLPAAVAALPQRLFYRQELPVAVGGSAQLRLERAELPNGMVVLANPRPAGRSAVVRFRLRSGAIRDPAGREGLAAFVARMLTRGGPRLTFAELNEATDNLGASLSTDAGRTFIELGIRCLREDLPTLLDYAADVLRRPAFPDEELGKVRNEILTGIAEADNDTRGTADRAVRRLLFPPPHPLGRRVSGDQTSVATIDRDDMVDFHRAAFGPNVTTVALVGGFVDLAEAVHLVEARFGDWNSIASPPPPIPPSDLSSTPLRDEALIPGKSQADLVVGFPAPPRSDPAHYALDTANLILGRLGLMGRLGKVVRDEQGLAYYAFSQVETGRESSLWTARAGVDPDNVDRALGSIIAEVRRLGREGVTPEELDDAKRYSTGVLPLALESNDGVAATLLNIEYYGLGLDYLDRYPDIIRALTREDLVSAWCSIDVDRLAVAVARPAPSRGPAPES